MADAAIKAELLADALDFSAELKENGREAGFGVLSAGTQAWNPSGVYSEAGKAFIFPSEWNQKFSDDVLADDLMFFVSNEVDLSNCTIMQDGVNQYQIKKIKPFMPDDLVIFYEIQVRA